MLLSVILEALRMRLLEFAYKSIAVFSAGRSEAGRFPGLPPRGYQGYVNSYAEPERKVISFV